MTRYWAKGLEGTIFPEKKETDKVSFLDPWTSLLAGVVKKRLASDILAIFTESGVQINGETKVAKAKLPFWALVFPKRTYVPLDYPHLQIWFLSHRFAPSISFIDQHQRQLLARILTQLDQVFADWYQKNKKLNQIDQALVINATPFSFVKNPKTGEYYWGGQSVRTFHIHYLFIPQGLKKVPIQKDKAALVYPTEFSHQLFRLILTTRGRSRKIFGFKAMGTKITKRGVELIFPPQKNGDLVEILAKIDQIFYNLQLGLISAFYQDSQPFLDRLADVITVNRLEKIKAEREKLFLLGKERPLEEIRARLTQELRRLGAKFERRFSEIEIERVVRLLTLDQNGDLASRIDDQLVVLRPGMGYGTLIKKKKTRLVIQLVPLDSLLSEGTMESSGYFFVCKRKVSRRPKWLKEVVQRLDQSFLSAKKEGDK